MLEHKYGVIYRRETKGFDTPILLSYDGYLEQGGERCGSYGLKGQFFGVSVYTPR